MTIIIRKHLLFLTFVGLAISQKISRASDGTAPSVSPSSEQKVEYSTSASPISFQGSGGEAAKPEDSSAPCPPWVKDGSSEWEWDASGGIAVDGSTTTDTLKIKRDTPAKGEVKVRFKQKWKDSPPTGTASTPTDTYSPWSSVVDVMIIKVEFHGLGTSGQPSFYDGYKFQTINAWAGSVKVTPKEAISSVNVAFDQWKNTTFTYTKFDNSSNTVAPTPGQDITFNYAPTVSGDIMNIASGDNPGPILNYADIALVSVNFRFNLYLRYKIDDAGVPWRTVGKVFWSWTGTLTHTLTPTNHFTPTGSSSTGSGSASTESPVAP